MSVLYQIVEQGRHTAGDFVDENGDGLAELQSPLVGAGLRYRGR